MAPPPVRGRSWRASGPRQVTATGDNHLLYASAKVVSQLPPVGDLKRVCRVAARVPRALAAAERFRFIRDKTFDGIVRTIDPRRSPAITGS
jgi:hypothetical protein